MAKLRVYELARELNLENKALLGKMEEMGIEVKSHMSSLDEAAIKQIKEAIFGTKAPEEVVEDKRIKPNVIRRRRKVVKPPVEPEVAETPEVSAKEEAKEPAPSEEAPEEKSVETPEVTVEKTAEEAEEPALPEAEKTVEADETVPVETAPEAQEQDVPAEVIKKETITEEKSETGVVEAAKTEAAAATEVPVEPEEEKPSEEKKPAPKTKKAKEKPTPKPVPKRKVKKGTPAKIISMPTEPVEPKRTEAPAPAKDAPKANKKFVKGNRQRPAAVEPAQVPPPPAEPGAKKKGRKKRTDAEVTDVQKTKKMKGSSRRKAVVEGSALYDKSFGRSRKGRKKFKSVPTGGGQKTQITTPKAIKRRFKVDDTIVLADLGKRMGIKANELIAKLMGMGMMVTVNQTIDFDTACLVATEFGFGLVWKKQHLRKKPL